MSIFGSYQLYLQERRELRRWREERRKQELRQEVTELIAENRQASRQVLNHITQHFGQTAQQESESLARQAEQLLRSDPDQALNLARNSRATAERGMAEASQKTAAWSREKATAQEAVTVLRLALESALNKFATDSDHTRGELTPVASQLAQANVALRREDFQTAGELAISGQEQIRKIEQARDQQQEQEEVRREIVRGLRQVLTDMGFSVDRAHLGDSGEEGKVVLVGSLPSGRTARFAIALDGKLDYDFDGYPRHESICGKDSEIIRRQLEQECQAKASNLEMHWKEEEPNRLSKDALQLPTNGQRDRLV